jgi:CelD/BcsL family acetyltransferase involved in cellulose biosynthesis
MLTQKKQDKVIKTLKSDTISLLTGEEVWTLLAKDSFQSAWDHLYASCPWATVFQSRAFVITWYQTYHQNYMPIVVLSEQDGQLTGLFTLALLAPALQNTKTKAKRPKIVGAGRFDAEYQTWLASACGGENFIKAALLRLGQAFPNVNIHLRFLPSQTPLKWLEEPHWKQRMVLQTFSRPLMELRDPDLSKKFRKTEFRNKLNRLKRLGQVDFHRIKNMEEFVPLLDELAVQYDFRQGAMFNKNNFKEDPLKIPFFHSLFAQNLLHVSVLKINGQLLSSIVAIAQQNWVHLGGINTHTPFQAKFYSPGFAHFIMLGQHLAQEGFAVFDLTPGGDFYKERMATTHDEVYELVISNSPIYRMKRQLRKQYYKKITQAGKWPMGVEVSLKKKLYLLKARLRQVKKEGVFKTVLKKIKTAVGSQTNKIYKFSAIGTSPMVGFPFQQNSLRDLLCYETRGVWPSRWEFMATAMRHLEGGQTVYSFSEGERLLGCVWLSTEGEQLQLQSFYCHPDAADRYPDFVAAVADAVVQEHPERPLSAQVREGEKTICQSVEAAGFIKST